MNHADIFAAIIIWVVLAAIFTCVAVALLRLGDRELEDWND